MSDIVERLMIECGSRWGDEDAHRLERQAAEAIDRLRAINAELLELLEWLDRLGGLGYDKHDRIRAAIAKAKPKSPPIIKRWSYTNMPPRDGK